MLIWLSGIACLAVGAAAASLVAQQLWRERHRVWSLMCGHHLPPAASAVHPLPRRPQLRVVEADAELTREAVHG